MQANEYHVSVQLIYGLLRLSSGLLCTVNSFEPVIEPYQTSTSDAAWTNSSFCIWILEIFSCIYVRVRSEHS